MVRSKPFDSNPRPLYESKFQIFVDRSPSAGSGIPAVKFGSSHEKNPEIINEITQGVSAWSEKKSKSKENIIHPEA